ncbi:CoA transferase [Arthrobacter cryoconiti]|uniref:CoA transferase n=1 Tax=Arthrobacter cryoconiti TaxID=748907 RepID=A0ABV8QW34_9MICC|nr:CoA transferase [Arthrobacter cryoconiti]MCC9069689.1 CoA transferase [Arthrobacter cryoconiti]
MSQPLSGIVIVTVAINLPGPLAASRLTELGARVIKVEPPTGDPLKSVAPAWYAELTAGQEVIELDLKSPSDRSRFEDLLVDADMLLTSMRPSALARLNLEEILKRRRIALVEIVGHDGPRAEQPGHDLTYQATQGTLQPPTLPLVPIADVLGAERAVVACLSALRQREQGETDVRERVVLEEAARAASAGVRHGLTSPGAMLGGASPLYGIYPTADGFLAVAALEPHFAARLAAHVGQTRQDLTREFALHPTAHWTELGQIHDIPLVAVREAARAVPELALAQSLPTNNHESE